MWYGLAFEARLATPHAMCPRARWMPPETIRRRRLGRFTGRQAIPSDTQFGWHQRRTQLHARSLLFGIRFKFAFECVCVWRTNRLPSTPPPLHPLYTMRGELILFSPSFCLLWTTQQCEDLAMDETQQKCVKMCEAIKKKIVDSSEIWILKTVLHYEKERFEINRII